MRRFGIYLGGRKAELPAPTSPLPLMGVQSAEVPGDATGEGDAHDDDDDAAGAFGRASNWSQRDCVVPSFNLIKGSGRKKFRRKFASQMIHLRAVMYYGGGEARWGRSGGLVSVVALRATAPASAAASYSSFRLDVYEA